MNNICLFLNKSFKESCLGDWEGEIGGFRHISLLGGWEVKIGGFRLLFPKKG